MSVERGRRWWHGTYLVVVAEHLEVRELGVHGGDALGVDGLQARDEPRRARAQRGTQSGGGDEGE
jgi:hypothetical protein